MEPFPLTRSRYVRITQGHFDQYILHFLYFQKFVGKQVEFLFAVPFFLLFSVKETVLAALLPAIKIGLELKSQVCKHCKARNWHLFLQRLESRKSMIYESF
jgi:hypothetical protein